jgi:hypothetical protein
MRNQAVGDDNPLKFHPMTLLITGVRKLLIHPWPACLPDCAIDESKDGATGCSKSIEAIGVLAQLLRGEKPVLVPVKEEAPPGTDERGCLVGDLGDSALGTAVLCG